MVEIHGHVTSGFEAIADAFANNFRARGDVGAACCVYVGGECVVDVWAGVADTTSGRPWQRDTLQLVMSVTKGAAAATVLGLVERGALELDATVSTYWPEFAAAGKEHVTVRHLLSHSAGLPAVDPDLTVDELLDGRQVVRALAEQRPLWSPGDGHGYHSLTFGYLLGELVRRVTDTSLAHAFRRQIGDPLDLDFWIGLPPTHEHLVSRLEPAIVVASDGPISDEQRQLADALQDPSSPTRRALGMSAALDFNDTQVHAAELPSANAICTARSLARMYAAMVGAVDGERVLGDDTVRAATDTQSEGLDKVLVRRNRYGLGFLLRSPSLPLPTEGAFGHTGAGGSLGFADPNLDVGFGYVTNQLQHHRGFDPRGHALIDALLETMA